MKRFALMVLLLALSRVQAPALQQAAGSNPPAQSLDKPAEPNLVFDDDGGKAQIVPADLSLAAQKKFHGGELLKSAQQVSIFLGAGWGDRQVRTRETDLADLSVKHGTHLRELATNKINVMSAAQGVEDFGDLSKTRVNNLVIQSKLAGMLAGKLIPAPAPSTIYVIYLAPGVNSSLGAHKAGVDYAAYHNFVHLDAGEVHYVVVPFHPDANLQGVAAARAFADTALNPNGTGWY